MSDETFHILYRDDRYIAIDKPAGILVHRTPVDKMETRFCVQILRNQIGTHVYPCHRLDKPTSGILLFALDKDALREVNELSMSHSIQKQYHAVVRGWVENAGKIDHPLAYIKDGGEIRGGGLPQNAVTEYRQLVKYEAPVALGKFPTTRYSMVELNPLTGRQHQLRRHMKHIFHPIIGDTHYGDGVHNRFFREHVCVNRLLLHACRMEFVHPATGEKVIIKSDMPVEFDIQLPTVD